MSELRQALVVDDDPDMRRMLGLTLRSRGWEVTERPDAESGLEAYQEGEYPLVLLDWVLPAMTGLDLCRRLRELPQGDRSVILLVTAKRGADELRAVLDAGADDYLAKPFDIDVLQVRLAVAEERVQSLLARKRAEAELAQAHARLEHSHDDLRAILDQLQVGSVLLDAEGRVHHLSRAAQRLLGGSSESVGRPWRDLLLLPEAGLSALAEMVERPPPDRSRLPLVMEIPGGAKSWLEVEVAPDPRDDAQRILFLYDVSEVHDLRLELDGKARFHDLVGKSKPMREVYQLIQDVAAVDSTVLIEGATGTGKELVARAIHFSGDRRDKPFVAVNCAGLSDSLLLSQLFGHKRGAFTGAVADHQGVFEAAQGGTLFLDEIGDVPMNVQTTLLRVLQEKEITRLGEARPRKVDVRVIAATHQDLNRAVAEGTFRSDLLYRIRVARVDLPPLRARREDIPQLVATFLGQARAVTGKDIQDVTQEAMRLLTGYPWPGNVRELKSAIEFAAIRCRTALIDAGDLPPEVIASRTQASAGSGAQGDEDILAALERAGGNRTEAARLLGISRATFYRRLTALKLDEGESADQNQSAET